VDSSEHFTAIATNDDLRKAVVAAVTALLAVGAGLDYSSAYQFFLNSHVDVSWNNGFVIAFNIVLRNDAGVLHSGLVKKVGGVSLLKKGVTDVFLVAQYFIGQSYLQPLSTNQVGIYNVTFEPGCRNNWHIHHAAQGGGQILLCVAGRGYYQEWGKEIVELKSGDCINIPSGVKHWHGAAPNGWFSHLAIEVPGEQCSNEWCEPVDDAQYNALK
jgi:quercetin dioxygenase-like cupin family protein